MTASPSSSPATATPPRTRSRRSPSSTTSCPPSSTWRPRSPRARRWSTATRAPTSASSGRLRRAGADYDETVAAAGDDVVVVQRRFRQQRLLPTPMEPRGVVVAPIAAADEFTVYSATQIPHILRVMLALVTGIPEHKLRVDRARRRRRLRRQAQRLRRGGPRARRRPQARPADQVDRVAQRELPGHRSTAATRSRTSRSPRRKDGTLLGLKVELLADMGAYLQLVTPGRAGARAPSCSRPSTRWTPTTSPAPACSPPRRPPTPTAAPAGRRRRTPSSGSWTSWPPSSGATRWSCASRTGSSTRSSRTTWSRGSPTTRATTRPPPRRPSRCSTWPGCGPSRPRRRESKRPGAARHRHLDLHRDVRPGAVAGARLAVVRRRRLGGGADPHAAHRQGRGRRRARRRTARATTPPGARSSPTRSACRSRTSRSSPATPTPAPRAWTPTARARWSSAASRSTRRPARCSRRPSGSPPTCSRPARTTSSSRQGTFSVKGSPEASLTIQEVALATFAAHNLPDGMEPTLDSDYVYDPENFSLPARHPPVRGRDRHRDRVHEDPQVRLRRRRRQDHQPGHRRGPDPRRAGAGHRAGAVRGGRATTRRATSRPARWSTTSCPRRPTCRTSTPAAPRPRRPATRSASRASARPARSPRRRPSSTRSSTRCGRSASTTSTCRPRPERVWRALHGAQAERARPPAPVATAAPPPAAPAARPAPTPSTRPGRRAVIPAAFDYVAPRRRRRGGRGARRGRRGRQDPRRRAEPHPGAAAAAGLPDDAGRPAADRRSCAGSARTATASSSAR